MLSLWLDELTLLLACISFMRQGGRLDSGTRPLWTLMAYTDVARVEVWGVCMKH